MKAFFISSTLLLASCVDETVTNKLTCISPSGKYQITYLVIARYAFGPANYYMDAKLASIRNPENNEFILKMDHVKNVSFHWKSDDHLTVFTPKDGNVNMFRNNSKVNYDLHIELEQVESKKGEFIENRLFCINSSSAPS